MPIGSEYEDVGGAPLDDEHFPWLTVGDNIGEGLVGANRSIDASWKAYQSHESG
ncbi:hypothetical protein [Rhizobium tropici]|uniref:hypothetical protein n=1 Tax=Rhizobium tropici TaxID=398 RepID=UPI0015EB7BB1|nr:hypothetical protein [Rhizobium tropici]